MSSACKIFLILQSDNPKAAACLRAELHGNCVTACLITLMFSGIQTLQSLPGGFFFKAEPVAPKFDTHNNIVLLSEATLFRPSLKIEYEINAGLQ